MKMREISRDEDKKLHDNNKLLGKSFITSCYVLLRCILYPNTQVVIAAGVKAQAMEIVTYIDRFRKNSDAVDKEISYLSDGKTDPKIDFWNGSTIRVVAANDNSRGKRANILIINNCLDI